MSAEISASRQVNAGVAVGVLGLGMISLGLWETFRNAPNTRDQIMRESPTCSKIMSGSHIRDFNSLEYNAEFTLLHTASPQLRELFNGPMYGSYIDCYQEAKRGVKEAGLDSKGWRSGLGTAAAPVGLLVSLVSSMIALGTWVSRPRITTA